MDIDMAGLKTTACVGLCAIVVSLAYLKATVAAREKRVNTTQDVMVLGWKQLNKVHTHPTRQGRRVKSNGSSWNMHFLARDLRVRGMPT